MLDFGQNHKYYLKKLCDKPFLEYPTDKLVSVGVAAVVVVAIVDWWWLLNWFRFWCEFLFWSETEGPCPVLYESDLP